ncbi:MAG TPA: hypothetical protein VLJ76_01160 [Gaiellaceae bacterium]|nr:hypothetical protein [Gaiellaceae bacterium]
MTSERDTREHDDAALEPETVKDIDPDPDETDDVQGGCYATHTQNPGVQRQCGGTRGKY